MDLPLDMLIPELVLYNSAPLHRIKNLIIYIFGIGIIHNAATKVFGNFASLQQLESKK